MKQVFALALKGLGHTSPNPLAGAVLVREDIILGIGFHQKYGSAHAEVNAILDAKANGFNIAGAILYCNLEPSFHTSMIIEEKISCVVISNRNPNPKVLDSGVNLLRASGVDVIEGVLESEGLELNEVFFKFVASNMPFVHLGESKYTTSQKSHAHVHSLRQKYDCIMVGRKTIEFDNPSLTTRTDEFETISHPLRIVVGKLQGLNHDWKILKDEFKRNTMIVATDDEVRNNQEVVRFLELQGVALLSVRKNEEGLVDLESLLKSLASLKLTSILVEGGHMLVNEFLKASLVDKVSFFVAPENSGDRGINNLLKKLELHSLKTEVLGNDVLVEGYFKPQQMNHRI